MKNEGKQNTICNKLWIFHKALSFFLAWLVICGRWCCPDQTQPCVVGCGQGASRFPGSSTCPERGLPIPKKSDGFAETQAATWRQRHSGDGESTVFSEGDKVSLSCLSLD